MKKFWNIFLTLAMIFSLCIVPATAQSPKIIDNAGLLDADEIAGLEESAQELADTYEMDVVILTIYGLDGKTPEDYADDYFDDHGYGVGPDHSGVLFLLDMDSRQWYMSTCGEAIYALTDYGIQQVFSEIASDLSGGDYHAAFREYLKQLDRYFAAYAQGDPIDGYWEDDGSYSPGTQENVVYYPEKHRTSWLQVFVSLAAGAVIAAVSLFCMRKGMTSVKAQRGAGNYLMPGSFQVTGHQDIFLYSKVDRTRRSDDNHNGGSRGGGSSVHTSSSGRSHGGGGGRF